MLTLAAKTPLELMDELFSMADAIAKHGSIADHKVITILLPPWTPQEIERIMRRNRERERRHRRTANRRRRGW